MKPFTNCGDAFPSVFIWSGDWGDYRLPEELVDGLRIRVDGWPDKRQTHRYARLMEWVQAQEAASKTDASGVRNG